MRVLGLDVGGANLKAADSDGRARTQPFALWRAPAQLAVQIERLIADFPKPDLIAVTMTGELADCYRTKAEGVHAILVAVERAAGTIPVAVWQTVGKFVSTEQARAAPLLVAAANWYALAALVARQAPAGPSLLIDVGTTTTDLIPLENGLPAAVGRTDRERLELGELVYTGVRRTPVCALVSTAPFRGKACGLAAELFATTLDVYLMTGDVCESPDDCDTANGQPATQACAHGRLARCLCCDVTEFSTEDAAEFARFIAAAQRRRIGDALDGILRRSGSTPRTVFVSGAGAFLAEQVILECQSLSAARRIRLAELFGEEIGQAACAFAVAMLAAEFGDR